MKLESTKKFSIRSLGKQETVVYDIEVEDNHNFVANNVLVHNSIYLDFSYLVEQYKKKNPEATIHNITDMLDMFAKKIIEPIIEESYEKLAEYMNCNENRMFMKREKIITKALWVAKKKYAMMVSDSEGVRYEKPKLKVMGLELIKSSTPKIVREKLKKVVELILTNPKEVPDFVESFRDEFYNAPVEQIAFPRGVSGLDKYQDDSDSWQTSIKGTPINSRGSLVYNNFIKKEGLLNKYPEIQQGEKIRFTYLKMPNPFFEDVIAFLKRCPPQVYEWVDYSKMYYKSFIRVIENIADGCRTKIKYKKEIDFDDIFE